MTDCSLYLISPPRLTVDAFAPQLEEALGAGLVTAFQLRLKEADDETIRKAARILHPICRAKEVAFILNDRPDLAMECDLDGVHLGQEDMPVAEARGILARDMVVGVSCHASRDMAIEAAEAGADYVAFGAFYPTRSKPQEKIDRWGVPTPELLEWWSTYTTIPCVAIGGVTPQNGVPLVAAGADFLAAITAVWDHPEGPGAAVRAFGECLRRKPAAG